jgi:hypothetical protein
MRCKVTKTRKVDGVDLSPSCFAYIGDESDTSTWKLPIRFPGDNDKTVNHIKNGLRRFDEMKHIPQSERMAVWLTLTGAAKAHGIHVEHKPKRVEAELNRDVLSDAELGAILADADRKTDQMLRMLGLS